MTTAFTTPRIVVAAAVLALAISTASAGVQTLTNVTDNSTDVNVPATDHLMVTVTTSASQGGNDASSTLISVGGTVVPGDVAAIHVYYQGLLVNSATSPASLTDVTIDLPGNQKGGQDWTYFLDLNGSAGGKTFNLTVTSITGTGNDVLPFTTATRNAIAANQPPTVTITDPGNGASIGGPGGYTITGTSSDPDGTVTSVDVRIQRLDDNRYWNGTGWTATETWNPASGTTSWSYVWTWTLDMDAVSVDVTARATDDQAATGTDTNNVTVDSRAPVNTVPTHLSPDSTPLSGEPLTLQSEWTENSPGANVPEFDWTLNGAAAGWTSADTYAGGVATRTTGVTLDGDDEITRIASRFTDSFGNGPTLSEDTTTVWVQPLTPPAPGAANNGTTDSLDVTINANASETGAVTYALECYDAGGAPTGYVQSNPGSCGASPVWQTAAAWGSPVVVTGLAAGTTYQFATAAGNPSDPTPTTGENSASPWSALASATTTAGNQSPTVTITDPTEGAAIGGPAGYTITGTASDDSAVTAVDVRIRRGTEYWNGSGWTTTETWNPATGTTAWSYVWTWTLDMDAAAVEITARATDDEAAQGTDVSNVTVDTVAPVNTVPVHLSPDATPLSGDELILESEWSESSASTALPEFQWTLNGAASGWSDASTYAGGVATRTTGVTLNGDDEITLIESRFADDFGNGPTPSQDATTVRVQPQTPQAPTAANNGTDTSLDVTIRPNPSETGTVWYAIRCYDGGGTPTGWVQSNPGGCGGVEVWQTQAAWGSPVLVTGLTASTTYRFATAAGNPSDATPTTGENSASPYSGQASASTSAPPQNDVTPGAASATIDSCNQITVTAPYTGDDNANSSTLFERSPNGTDTWTTVTGCDAVTGPSPRQCVDANVADSSVNYYRVTFSDPDNSPQPTPEVIGPYDTTPFCAADGTTIVETSAEASSCSQVTVTARFTDDANDDGTTRVETAPAGTGTWTTACEATSGASPRQCIVPALDASTAYDVRVTFTDPDGVAPDGNATPTTETVVPPESPVTTPACSGDGSPPTIFVLSPQRDAILGGVDWVRVQVHDVDGLAATDPVQWSVDGGPFTPATENTLPGYACGDGCTVWEFQLDTTSSGLNLSFGAHELTLQATDGATPANVARVGRAFRVNNTAAEAPAGDGLLLRRTRGSQMCRDCHNLPTHSSQSTSKKYGNWAMDCATCHTPHGTSNIFLLRETIRTPSSGERPVRFESLTGATVDSSTPGSASYVNEDNATRADGPCQACHTRTRSVGGDARWRNSDAGGNVDTHYTSASTSRCTGCHTHDAGFSGAGGACDSCHDAPPPNTDDGPHESHYALALGVPEAYDGLTPATTATDYGFACAKCHSGSHLSDSTSAGDAGDPYDVEIVFDDTQAPANGGGSYSPATQSADQGPDGRFWGWSTGTCSGLYCHSNAGPVGVGAVNEPKDMTWDTAVTVGCTSCHNTQGRTDSGVASDLSTAHGKHIQSTSGEANTYSFKCDECHSATIVDAPNDPWNLADADLADKREHVDGEKDVVISTAYDGDADGANNFDGLNFTCSDTYCHSLGTTATGPYPPPQNPSLAWNTDTTTCRSCHAGDAAASPTMGTDAGSATHARHVDNDTVIGTNYECATCHASTVGPGDNGTITGFASHVDKVKTVAGSRVGTYAAPPTCTDAYCHSSGQEVANREYYSANWTSPTPLDCKGCHGRHSDNAFSSVAGEPNYTNGGVGSGTENSHNRHVSAATDCTKCHNDTTVSGTTISLGSLLHTDEVRDVRIASSWDAQNDGDKANNYAPAGKTCSDITCHGGVGSTAQWGATLTCLQCHTGDEATNALSDGVPNAVDDEWLTDGHGSAAGGSLDSALDGCDYCHQLDAAHTPTDPTSPYRLRFATNDNTLCLQCHGGGPDGTLDNGISQNSDGTALTPVDSSLDVDAAHDGAKHDTSVEGGRLCWDCHDPHGVPSNILMVKSLVSKTADAYGIPTVTVTVNFTDNTTPGPAVGHFVETTNTPRTGICQACHDPAGQGASGPTDYWRSNGTIETHNPDLLCSDCHEHRAKFAGAGGDCLGCHGNTGDAGTVGPNSRRAVQGDFAKNSHHVGDGGTIGGALTNYDCVVCHAEGRIDNGATAAVDTLHKNAVIDLRDTDSTDDANGPVTYYSYAKDSITGTFDTWMSGNTSWETQTVKLDRFCLSCHDADGATASFNDGTGEGLGHTGTALNPFADTSITNSYDQQSRGRVVNIRNKVDSYVDGSNNPITPVDREGGGEPRTPDGRPDPTQGIYSRHAIRGDGSTWGASSVYGSSQIPTDRWTARPTGGSWNDTSLMGCADCHTTDGANGTNGNAHGSNTEYLLKNKDGSATTEPLFDIRSAGTSQINCYKCHTPAWYARERNFEHTDNNSDWVFTADQTGGANRRGGNGNIYGLPCTNCHGGAPSAVGTGFGTIHGTSDLFNINAGPAQRQAYRFMNGASLRYFDPGDWNASSVTCYTLSTGDSFGGCTQHVPGNGKAWTRPVTRNIQY